MKTKLKNLSLVVVGLVAIAFVINCRSTRVDEHNLCTQQETICTMNYAPSSCTYGATANGFSSSGSNQCQARKNMLAAMCERYSVVTEEMMAEVSCVVVP